MTKQQENKEVKHSKVAAKKREAILRAAMELFRRHGFKRASIDQIAEAARVAKPTIYAHFADKDALFAAVCALFLEQALLDAAKALLLADTVKRFASFLSAKFTFYFEIVLRSPYANELLDATNTLAQEMIETSDLTYRAMLVQEIERCNNTGELSLLKAQLDAGALADTLLQAGHGAEYQAKTADEHRANLLRLTTLLLSAALGTKR